MKFAILPVLALFVCACSETPTETKTKTPEKPPEPITGRQAFQYTYPSARMWAPDAEPLTVQSLNLEKVTSEDGKAGAWEIVYVSMQLGRARTYSWSAIELDNLHKGVFGGADEAWRGPVGQQRPFPSQGLKIDTPEALNTATKEAAKYLSKPGEKPPITFLLESTPRFPNPVWRVLWGPSVSAAKYSVTVDATTGDPLARD
ncbi:MAG: hypothetical protein JO307_04220 [Bryobacterales bacterium]|nr:hypothetical protein [Bryobacterales bacterium]MBV9398522.1 hypothetical protein [Bryobacterales bacterium]